MPVGQRGQRAHPPPLITLCTDQELLLSSAWLSLLKRRRCLRDLAKVVFVCPSPASLFSLVECWMVGNKKTCARYLWCINKRLRGGGRGWGGGSLKGDAAAGSIPISILLHSAMEMRLWVSVALCCFLKWMELESDWQQRVRWILSS